MEITRNYRITTDDDLNYIVERVFVGKAEDIPSIENDVKMILNTIYVQVTDSLFIPTSKIKKILYIQPRPHNDYY